MKSFKGKKELAGGADMPLSRPGPRIVNGLRRAPGAKRKTAAAATVPVPMGAGARLQERMQTRLSDLLAAEFAAYAQRGPIRKRLAARLGKTPEEIGRWLSGSGTLAADTVNDLLAAVPAAKPARRAGRPRKAAAPAADAPEQPVVQPASLTVGTTIAVGATMVGTGIAVLASIDVNPVAQVEVV